jgi:hypothetical protein
VEEGFISEYKIISVSSDIFCPENILALSTALEFLVERAPQPPTHHLGKPAYGFRFFFPVLVSVAHPGSGAFLTARSGIGLFRISILGSRIPNAQFLIFESLVTIFLVKTTIILCALAQILSCTCSKMK